MLPSFLFTWYILQAVILQRDWRAKMKKALFTFMVAMPMPVLLLGSILVAIVGMAFSPFFCDANRSRRATQAVRIRATTKQVGDKRVTVR